MTNEARNRQSSSGLDRRKFLATASGIVAAGALGVPATTVASPIRKTRAAETAVKELYATLSDAQKKAVCFPFEHKLRSKINPNWKITKHDIGDDFYSKSQQELAARIVKSLCSDDGYKRLLKQMDDDDGGIDAYSMAIFGKPDSGEFEWELTGRHLTLRADGDSVKNTSFGGPIVYGHGEEEAKQNLFYYQTKQVNKIFGALDKGQREASMIEKLPGEGKVKLQGKKGRFQGISLKELSSDQKQLVTSSLKVLLAPFRQEDVDEVMAFVKKTGGIESLHMSFARQGDLEKDKLWDMWRIEGPNMVWHFRGAPHVHAYINIGTPAGSLKSEKRG